MVKFLFGSLSVVCLVVGPIPWRSPLSRVVVIVVVVVVVVRRCRRGHRCAGGARQYQ